MNVVSYRLLSRHFAQLMGNKKGIPLTSEAIKIAEIQMACRFKTRQHLADTCGLSKSTVDRIFNGKGIKNETLQVFCNALGLAPGELIQQTPGSDPRQNLVEQAVRNGLFPNLQSAISGVVEAGAEKGISMEIHAVPETIPLRCWKRLPDCQGVYGLFTLTWSGTIHICTSSNMRFDFEADSQTRSEIRELFKPDASCAWIVWGKCSDKTLLQDLRQEVIQTCKSWMCDPDSILTYDAEYDCEKGWCPDAPCEVPDSILSIFYPKDELS